MLLPFLLLLRWNLFDYRLQFRSTKSPTSCISSPWIDSDGMILRQVVSIGDYVEQLLETLGCRKSFTYRRENIIDKFAYVNNNFKTAHGPYACSHMYERVLR